MRPSRRSLGLPPLPLPPPLPGRRGSLRLLYSFASFLQLYWHGSPIFL